MVLSRRAAASACTLGATPWAENTTVAPSGTSDSSSTKMAPRCLEGFDDVSVVHDLLAHVDRRAVGVERPLDGDHRAVDAGAVAARCGHHDVLDRGVIEGLVRIGHGDQSRSAVPASAPPGAGAHRDLSVRGPIVGTVAMESSPEQPQSLARVVRAVKGWVERLGAIWVEAQVIEIRRRADANTQFLTLRDPLAEVSATVTCSRAVLDAAGPLTEGSTVTALVRPTVWSATSRLSFECSELRPSGEGRLLAQIEQRKRLLQAEGLFDQARKKRLPVLPRAIGLVTGKDSAAERDVVTNIRLRWPGPRSSSVTRSCRAPRPRVR